MARARSARRREENQVEFSRIVSFSDGVFAIAITLLVLNLHIGHGLSEGQIDNALWDQRDELIAFAISFAVIGRFWAVHHRFFSGVAAFDGRLMALNLFYLAWIVLIPFSSEVLGEYGGTTAGVVLYSANLTGVVLVGLLMAVSARRGGLTRTDDRVHRETQVRSAYIAGVFLLSIPLGFIAPSVAPYLWLVLVVDPTERIVSRGEW